MYGTVARMKIKPGAEEQLRQISRDFESIQVPGFVSQQIYRLDAHPNEYILVVAFESKDAYVANAGSPAQNDRYQQIRALLAAEPEWHDGEIVASYPPR
ncbi:MAG TPA: antibiotic biosynthesis monooxygenase [Thermomicrobiales bacterium]|jgi:quinol monooxygenase YgiN